MQSRETDRTTKTKSPRIPSHPQSPNNGALFVFAIRPSQRIATPAPAESPVPTDVTGNRPTAPAHTETRPVPPRRNGQPTDSTCTQSASLAPPQDRLKTTSEAQKQIFGPYCNFFVFTKRFSAIRQISKGRITIMRRLRKGRIASARKSRKGRSPQQRQIPQKEDRHNRRRVPFVSMMCIRAIVRPVLFYGPRTDAHCSH